VYLIFLKAIYSTSLSTGHYKTHKKNQSDPNNERTLKVFTATTAESMGCSALTVPTVRRTTKRYL